MAISFKRGSTSPVSREIQNKIMWNTIVHPQNGLEKKVTDNDQDWWEGIETGVLRTYESIN